MIKIKVNEDKEFEFSWDGERLQINNIDVEADIIKLNDHFYHILIDGKSTEVLVQKKDPNSNCITLQINGQTYTVTSEDRLAHLYSIIGASSEESSSNAIHSPMPGLIMEVKCKVGDRISPDAPIIILEAMKMENALKPEKIAIVKEIHVTNGQNVEKGELLIELEDISS